MLKHLMLGIVATAFSAQFALANREPTTSVPYIMDEVESGVQLAQELADRWSVAYNSHDGNTLSALYAEDAALFAGGNLLVSGRPAIQAYWTADMVDSNPKTILTVTETANDTGKQLVAGKYVVVDARTGSTLAEGKFWQLWTMAPNAQWQLERDLWETAKS